jgi:hypothetical protein
MAHYAFLDENNIVTEVIVGIDETQLIEGLEPEIWYGNFKNKVCKRTSYSGSYRKNFAGVGYVYNYELDAFYPPSPHKSWVLNTENCKWVPPTPYPNDENRYFWDEASLSWTLHQSNEKQYYWDEVSLSWIESL